ncbi:MAG: hypothetical protein ACI8PZ_005081 [Myxococcota bacterium]|jgi:hypothetical protein
MLMLLAATALAAPSLTLDGECPGRVTFDMADITPTGNVMLFAGSGRGSEPVEVGHCAGTNTGLAGPLRWFGPVDERDGDGLMTLSRSMGGGGCRLSFALLDLATCELSAVRSFVEPDPVFVDTYTGASQTVYKLEARDLPPGDAAIWYQEICEGMGLRPVSCDPARWGDTYDATAWNAVVLDADHYSCNVSSGIMSLTGWDNIITYHRPLYDVQGVCERGCTISGLPVYPICTD